MSGSDSSDSDERIRFKTESVRKISPDDSFNVARRYENYREYDRRRRSSSREKSKRYDNRYHSKKATSSRRRSRSPKPKPRKREHRHRSHSSSSDETSRTRRNKNNDNYKSTSNSKPNIKVEDRSVSSRKQVRESTNVDSSKLSLKEEEIGPILPPNLQKQKHVIGPSQPSHLRKHTQDLNSCPEAEERQIGPALPPHLQKQENKSQNDNINIGPMLPPHMQKPDASRSVSSNHNSKTQDIETEEASAVIGPTLPPNLQSSDQKSLDVIGPCLPPHLQKTVNSEESDDDIIGPLPSNSGNLTKGQILLEERALEIKLGGLNPKDIDKTVREEWMLELPQAQAANLGLGSRQFRKNAAPDMSDRSSWTDTPAEKEAKKKAGQSGSNKKVDLKREAEMKEMRKRDKEQEKIIEKLKKKKNREKSLVDMHTEKLKKKKLETATSNERRPFNRETDLQVNRFDEAQKKAVLKKAQLLDSRFSSGETKFL